MTGIFEKYVVRPDSPSANIQYWSDPMQMMEQDHYEAGVKEILGMSETPSFDTEAESRLYFLYSIEMLRKNEIFEPESAFLIVRRQVEAMTAKYPWSSRDGFEDIEESQLSAPKAKKVRKMSDKDKALRWWKDNLDALKVLRPGEIQDRMATDLGIHRNSCRGIYYTCKKEMPLA